MFDKYFYTYVLRSLTDLKFYVGFTSNLMQRFEAHNSGKVSSTKNRIPFELVYFEGCQSKEDAMHREKYLKTFYGKMFLKNRLKSYLTG
jgi:putative endonuclease